MLTCYYFNAQSIVNKICELHYILYHVAPDCVLVTESWLNADVCDGLLDPKSLYTVIRKDRVGCRGGGVCALVKRSHSVLPLTFHEKYSELEIVGFDFVGGRPALRIFVVYRPHTMTVLSHLMLSYSLNVLLSTLIIINICISLSVILIYPI